MARETLSSALEREHQEIDAAIEAYAASLDPADLRAALTALRRHIYLEEKYLFPPLRDGGLLGPIFVMLREHGELWAAMALIDARLAADEDAIAACRDLLARLAAHNDKEEPIVYPEVDKIAHADAVLELLSGATMPDGWACERAPAN
ncbi:hemerythrin domain-containing protein [Tomitella biformata]|uniref:hemerythrin domain-containing protein n=1 Tax=Tomitella biformata TaxID=630403 RepID=UPI000464AE2E|nr:hemerythrin domain-containing protein [Tomitella biformata]